MGSMGHISSNFGESGDQVYLVSSKFVTHFFHWNRRVTSKAQLFISGRWGLTSPGPTVKASVFQEKENGCRKRVGAIAARQIMTGGMEEEREAN